MRIASAACWYVLSASAAALGRDAGRVRAVQFRGGAQSEGVHISSSCHQMSCQPGSLACMANGPRLNPLTHVTKTHFVLLIAWEMAQRLDPLILVANLVLLIAWEMAPRFNPLTLALPSRLERLTHMRARARTPNTHARERIHSLTRITSHARAHTHITPSCR